MTFLKIGMRGRIPNRELVNAALYRCFIYKYVSPVIQLVIKALERKLQGLHCFLLRARVTQ